MHSARYDVLRHLLPIPVGPRQKLLAAEHIKGDGVRLTFENTMEIEGQTQPALVAEGLSVFFP